MKHTAYKNAHANGAYGAVWLDERTIASGGADGAVRQVRAPYLRSSRGRRPCRSSLSSRGGSLSAETRRISLSRTPLTPPP